MNDAATTSVIPDPGSGGDRAAAWNSAAREATGRRLVLVAAGGNQEEHAGRHSALAGDADELVFLPGSVSIPRATFLEVGGVASRRVRGADVGLVPRLCAAGCVPRGTGGADALRAAGRLSAESFAGHPAMRRDLIGTFRPISAREAALRRVAIAARVPSRPLAALGRLPGGARLCGLGERLSFWRGVREGAGPAAWPSLAGGVPVLMYHAFSADGSHDRYTLPRPRLARQLRVLATLGYRGISVGRLAAALRNGEPLPRRVVAITIDDGYRDNLEIAWPELRRRGFVATIFMVSDRVGAANDWDDDGLPAGRALLDGDQLRLLRSAGAEIGAHTRSHVHLPEADAETKREEVAGSRRDLEALLDAPVEAFAYPYGGFDAADVAVAEEAGYRAACTTETRLAAAGDDPWAIPRIEVHDHDTTWSLLLKLWVGS
jgi:peptidoglycan/xylan/chitin deacetylase (PgdA/CDA1 family)